MKQAAGGSVKGAALRVVLADDSELMRRMMRMILKRMPHADVVAEAHDGNEAVARTRELHPDLVLMDIEMPGMDGLEATRHIKRLAKPPRVVILTLNGGTGIELAARRAGADGFCDKTHMDEALQPIVRDLFPSVFGGDDERKKK